jgi:hypothetical protein
MKRILAVGIAAITLTGCAAIHRAQMANYASNPEFEICYIRANLNPSDVRQCFLNNDSKQDTQACLVASGLTEAQKPQLKECLLQAQASRLAKQTTTTCYRTLFGGYTCSTQ